MGAITSANLPRVQYTTEGRTDRHRKFAKFLSFPSFRAFEHKNTFVCVDKRINKVCVMTPPDWY